MVKTLSKFKIIISMVICLVIASSLIPVANAASSIYESEYNDTYAYAENLYDDYNVYGKITNSNDVDCWNISFSYSGMANFYLGNIPSGCDYELEIYKSNGTKLLAVSCSGGNTYELIKCHVYANTVYTIKIYSASGFSGSDYYLIRSKRYDLSDVKLFVFEYTEASSGYTSSQSVSTQGLTYAWSMGYQAGGYLNNSVSAAYSTLPYTDVFIVVNHANNGFIRFNQSGSVANFLYAKSGSHVGANDRAVSTFGNGGLSNTELVIYGGCKTGGTDGVYGNLVDETINAGAFCSFGFIQSIDKATTNYWFVRFLKYCSQAPEDIDVAQSDYSIENAIYCAYMETQLAYPRYADELNSIYRGNNNNTGRLVIGANY